MLITIMKKRRSQKWIKVVIYYTTLVFLISRFYMEIFENSEEIRNILIKFIYIPTIAQTLDKQVVSMTKQK